MSNIGSEIVISVCLSFVLTISMKIIQYCIRSLAIPVLEHSM